MHGGGRTTVGALEWAEVDGVSEWFLAGLIWGWILGIATAIGFVGYRSWRYGPQRIEWRGEGSA